jgi:hypothetical protein
MLAQLIKTVRLLTVLSASQIFCSCQFMLTDEEFLLPNGYSGPVIIFFDQSLGASPIYKGSSRVYLVPSSGILYSQFSRPKGLLSQEFWYIDERGKKVSSCIPCPTNDFDSNISCISNLYDGQFSINSVVDESRKNYSNHNAKRIKFIYFFIGPVEEQENGIIETKQILSEIISSYPHQ